MPYPRSGWCTTRAPIRSAIDTEASVEPLSQTTISPSIPASANVRRIFSMHGPIASSSSRHGMTTETNGSWVTGPP